MVINDLIGAEVTFKRPDGAIVTDTVRTVFWQHVGFSDSGYRQGVAVGLTKHSWCWASDITEASAYRLPVPLPVGGVARDKSEIIGGSKRKCQTCPRDQPSKRMPFFLMAPPPPRVHIAGMAPFSTSEIVEPKWFCRPCSKQANSNGWVFAPLVNDPEVAA